MIKIDKDLINIPLSLLASLPKIDSDTKIKLAKDQHDKCCYCEESHIDGQVEHFRPKSKYPNLEFEWTNLLWSCWKCNHSKLAKFDEEFPIINPTIENPVVPTK